MSDGSKGRRVQHIACLLTFQTAKSGFRTGCIEFPDWMWHDEPVQKGVLKMSEKSMKISTAIYILNAVIWTVNFFLNWVEDGMLKVSTVLFGISAVCFIIASVGAVLALCRKKREERKNT